MPKIAKKKVAELPKLEYPADVAALPAVVKWFLVTPDKQDDDVQLFVVDGGEKVYFWARLGTDKPKHQELIGGNIEMVKPSPAVRKAKWRGAWADEEGMCKKLEYNVDASALCLSRLFGPILFTRSFS